MKKFTALLTAAALSICMTACSSNTDNNTNPDNIDSAAYRIGIGSYTTTDSSYSSVEGENGTGVVSTTYATVVFDSNDIIKKVYIDQVESKVYFDAKGQIVTNGADTNIRTKRELGDEYGMKSASPIGKEWYEQINGIESWLVGKNIRNIASGVMNGNMYGDGTSSDSVTDGISGAAGNIADGIENIADDVTSGAESIVSDVTDNMADNTDGTIGSDATDSNYNGNDSNGMVNGTGSSMSDSTDSSMSGGSSSDSNAAGETVNWDEDLKTIATIDTTDIQIALQKAYENAK
ncbi:MAG: hypothetical protein J6K30_01835 [Oscillospiraceae bacterium]|nr:hypothetical protein [Oscillospiraceae bacterium]